MEELAVAYPDQEDLVQVYKEWGDSAYLQELFKVLDSYEPDWNKEKELGSWAAEFLLDILEEEEWEEMTNADVVRHVMVQRIVRAYESYENAQNGGKGKK